MLSEITKLDLMVLVLACCRAFGVARDNDGYSDMQSTKEGSRLTESLALS